MLENTVQTEETTELIEVVDTPTSIITEELGVKIINTASSLEKAKRGLKINSDYHKFDKVGDKARGVFMGFVTTRFKKKDGSVDSSGKPLYDVEPGVRWMEQDLTTKICSGTALVNEIKKFGIEVGTMIEIEYTGKPGNTKLFDIFILKSAE